MPLPPSTTIPVLFILQANGVGFSPASYNAADGYDLFVDTDAGIAGGENHLMVHDKSCAGTGGEWRDMVDGSCRN